MKKIVRLLQLVLIPTLLVLVCLHGAPTPAKAQIPNCIEYGYTEFGAPYCITYGGNDTGAGCTDPFMCNNNPGGGQAGTGCDGAVGITCTTGGQISGCVPIGPYTVRCVDSNPAFGPWYDCSNGGVAVSTNPLVCEPPSSGGGGGGVVVGEPCTSCGCPGYAPCQVANSLSVSVDCTARLIIGSTNLANSPIWVSYVPYTTWASSGTSDANGNYAISMAGAPNSGTMMASLQGNNAVATTYSCALLNPVGFIDYCTTDGITTSLFGWAYDPDSGASDADPSVTVNISGIGQQTVPTDQANYRTGDINTYLDNKYPGQTRGTMYGFVARYTNMVKGNNYIVDPSYVNNSGPGATQQIGVNYGTDFSASFPGSLIFGADGSIPQGCLVNTYKLSASTTTKLDDGVGNVFNLTYGHTITNNSAGNTQGTISAVSHVTIRKALSGVTSELTTPSFPLTDNITVINAGTSSSLPTGSPSVPVTLDPGDEVCAWVGISPFSNSATEIAANGGSYIISTASAANCIKVTNKPYIKILGDIRSGASVRGWNKGSGNYNLGSTSSGVVVANTDAVNGVASGVYLTNQTATSLKAPASAKGLTLSNTPPSAAANVAFPTLGEYGGLFQSNIPYVTPVSFNDPTYTSAAVMSSPSNITGSPNTTQAYKVLGDLTLNASSIKPGQRTTVYVAGNVTITGNITYSNAASGYSSINDIPSVRVIASGNVYIDPNVTDLDGLYVAGNTLYSCHDGSWGTPINAKTKANPGGVDLYSICNKPLTVWGGLIATNLKLTRSAGSLRSAQATDGIPAGNSITNKGNIAESIVYTYEQYLSQPAGATYRTSGGLVDSITALPPIF